MDPRLVELALSQHGVFSLAQAEAMGVGARSVHAAAKSGTLTRTLPQVYRLTAAAETWECRLMAAQLWLGDPASLSHASAAALWTLPGFPHGPVELSTPRPKKPLPPVVVHKVGVDLKRHTTTVGPLRVTNAGRTLADIAGCVSNEMLERCLEDVLRRRLTSVGHLRWLVRGRYGKGAKGVAKLQSLIDPGSRLTESDLEIRLLHAIRRASLPEPVRQYEIFHNGLLVARPDFAYPWAKVAIEADSYQFHSGRQAWEHDLRRRNALTSLGWLVIHVTHKQLESNVNEVVVRIREALLPSLAWHKE